MEREKSIEIENLQARWGWGGALLECVPRQRWEHRARHTGSVSWFRV